MKVGIIGGTGVYNPELLQDVKKIKVHTQYGSPSDLIITGKFKGVDAVIIPRHGTNHTINPTNVNYRANIWAMKQLGVTRIISVSAVGSLREEMKPGDFVFTDQFIDFTKYRKNTFYAGQQVCHVGTAEPFCPELRKTLVEEAKRLKLDFHEKGTCVVIEGPRFSTKAESKMFQNWGGDIINMTMCPEVILAVEAEICYANIAMVTDYDVWKDHAVSNDEVLKTMKMNIDKVRKLIGSIIPKIKEERNCKCKDTTKNAMM